MLNSIITDETSCVQYIHDCESDDEFIVGQSAESLKTVATAERVPALPPPSRLHQVMGVEFHHLHRKQAIEIPILREQDELHSDREGKRCI